MVISIEPGIYLNGFGGVRHSDTIIVTKDGYEALTKLPTDLDCMILKGKRLRARIKGRIVRRVLRVDQKAQLGQEGSDDIEAFR